jgi:hypothetical protein
MIIGSARSSSFGVPAQVSTQNYYNPQQGYWLGFMPSPAVANNISNAMLDACNNDNILYSQAKRNGVYNELKAGKSMYNIDKTTYCDCSSLVRACLYANGYPTICDFNTASEPSVLRKLGFQESKITSVSQCKDGMILVTPTKGHTVICIDENKGKTTKHIVPTCSPNLKKGSKGERVKQLQDCLNYVCNAKLEIDGSFGPLTEKALKTFQSSMNIDIDGVYGKQSRQALLTRIK